MHGDEPLLSVVVPIYNVGEYLSQCIESVISQTYKSLEIILVDDGAKGNEPEICDRYACADGRIRVIHKQNEGLVAARRTGVLASTADYITFVDGDDWIEPYYYEKMMRGIIEDGCDIIATGIKKVFIDGREERLIQPIDDGVYEREDLKWLTLNMNAYGGIFYNPGIFPSLCTKIFKTSLIKDIINSEPDRIKIGEDAAVSYPYLLKCNRVKVDNTIFGYNYRVSDESMTRTYSSDYFYDISALYDHLLGYYDKACNLALMERLEIYRAYLLYLGINNLKAKLSICSKFKESKHLIEIASHCSVLMNLKDIYVLEVPRSLKAYTWSIDHRMWIVLGMIWIVRSA